MEFENIRRYPFVISGRPLSESGYRGMLSRRDRLVGQTNNRDGETTTVLSLDVTNGRARGKMFAADVPVTKM